MAQYGRRNNVIFSGIPENVPDNNSESTVISILSEIDVEVEPRDIKECHRIGKPTSKTQKTIAGSRTAFVCGKANEVRKDERSESNAANTGRKLNVHKMFRRCPGRLLNVFCTFNLRPVSAGNAAGGFFCNLTS